MSKSKRLQVLFTEEEYSRLKKVAKQSRMSLGEWVRVALRRVSDGESLKSPEDRLKVLRHALTFGAPVDDVKTMKAQISKSYLKS